MKKFNIASIQKSEETINKRELLMHSLEIVKKLDKNELDTLRWHINALLGDDYLNVSYKKEST